MFNFRYFKIVLPLPSPRSSLRFGFQAQTTVILGSLDAEQSILLQKGEVLYANLDGGTTRVFLAPGPLDGQRIQKDIRVDLRTAVLRGHLKPLLPGLRRLITGKWQAEPQEAKRQVKNAPISGFASDLLTPDQILLREKQEERERQVYLSKVDVEWEGNPWRVEPLPAALKAWVNAVLPQAQTSYTEEAPVQEEEEEEAAPSYPSYIRDPTILDDVCRTTVESITEAIDREVTFDKNTPAPECETIDLRDLWRVKTHE